MIFLTTLDEIKKAIKQASIGKVSGIDGFPDEILKAAGPETLDTFDNKLTSTLEEEVMQYDFSDMIVITLFKNKGKKADCGNYQSISLLSIVGKILAWVILQLHHLPCF